MFTEQRRTLTVLIHRTHSELILVMLKFTLGEIYELSTVSYHAQYQRRIFKSILKEY